jgi:hypothetical protein
MEGESYFDAPEEEYPAPKNRKVSEPEDSGQGARVFPCYVYDAKGVLLRIEYPKSRELKWDGLY